MSILWHIAMVLSDVAGLAAMTRVGSGRETKVPD